MHNHKSDMAVRVPASQLKFGVMQGRLSPPEDGRFQSFPRHSWREEFARARATGLDYIEWIHDAYGYTANPIFTPEGLAEFDALKREHSIATPALCGDWFMDFPLIRCTPEELAHREQHLHQLIPIAARISTWRMVLPFVDQSRIATESEKQQVIDVLNRALPIAQQHNVELHLETDFNPADFAAFLDRIPHPFLKVNWDSGNSSGLGYIAHEEFAAYGNRIGSVHIKDRYKKPEGGVETRPLGHGSADFDDVFASLRSLNYTGGLTLQVARGKPSDEVNFIKTQLDFLKRYC
jgi:hexulose-6-phosphate isomerase